MDAKFARQYSLYQLPQNLFLRLHVCPHFFIHAHSNEVPTTLTTTGPARLPPSELGWANSWRKLGQD